jgi:hypothetical protein
MATENRSMVLGERRRTFVHAIEPLVADFQAGVLLDADNDIQILRIDSVVAHTGATELETIEVGTVADPDFYVSYAIPDSGVIGTVVNHTLLSRLVLSKNTPLIVKKATADADAGSTGRYVVLVSYVFVDNPTSSVGITTA